MRWNRVTFRDDKKSDATTVQQSSGIDDPWREPPFANFVTVIGELNQRCDELLTNKGWKAEAMVSS